MYTFQNDCRDECLEYPVVCDSGTAAIKFLKFDSDCLKMRIGEILNIIVNDSATLAPLIKTICFKGRDKCLDYLITKVNADESLIVEALKDHGFRCVDTLIKLTLNPEKKIRNDSSSGSMRIINFQNKYFNAVINSFSQLFKYSRYYNDPCFSSLNADFLYKCWLENNLNGRADINHLCMVNDELAGFISCILLRESVPKTLLVDLVGVKKKYQGLGIGSALLSSLFVNNHDSFGQIEVGTQSNNTAALQLYKKNGFDIKSKFHVFHYNFR